jgi:hypothetical protein
MGWEAAKNGHGRTKAQNRLYGEETMFGLVLWVFMEKLKI